MNQRFRVTGNPERESQLTYRLFVPVDGGLVLKAREPWPRYARVFCAEDAAPCHEEAELGR